MHARRRGGRRCTPPFQIQLNPPKYFLRTTIDCLGNINRLARREQTHEKGWQDEACATPFHRIKMVLAWVLAKDSLILSAYPCAWNCTLYQPESVRPAAFFYPNTT